MTTFGWGGTGATFNFVVQPCPRPHVPPGAVCVPADFLRDALRLVHPDLHSETREELATKVTQYITARLAESR